MAEYRHSGIGFPNGPVSNDAVFALPSPELLMLSTEGRYHHDAAVRAGKRVLWRSIPRVGKRPAELGWSPARFVTETINLTDAPTLPITDFVWANELDLNYERGDREDDFLSLERRYALIGGWAPAVVQSLRQWSPGTRIHWPAWTPDHNALIYVEHWRAAAELCGAVDFHAYDSLDRIEEQYRVYREAFPSKPLVLTEWHCKGDLSEERRVLAWLSEAMVADPLFEAAHFFIWRWHDAPGWWDDRWDVEHSPARLALFMDPPTVQPAPKPTPPPEPIPMPEKPDPYEHWSADTIAAAAGCPVEAVRDHWPRLVEQLNHCGIADRDVQRAMIATVAIETASTFSPVREAFWLSEDWRRANLRYYPYYGRGFIQLTWESNYRTYGPKIAALWGAGGHEPDFDLVGNPDNALNPDIAAAVAALYVRDHAGGAIPVAARNGHWSEVRRLVQGGSAGLDRLVSIVALLEDRPVPLPDLAGYVFPVDGYTGEINLHWGTFAGGSDLFAPEGTPVRAIHAGTVVYRAEWGAIGGNAVQLSGDDGLQSYYAHGDRPPAVGMGQRVEAGAFLFGVGDSGNAAGRGHHLHFGMGRAILTGSGPTGGAGSDFDAVGFLRRLQAAAPRPADELAQLQTLVGVLTAEDGVVVPALRDALANPDEANLRLQADAVLRFIRENRPRPAA